MHANLYKKFFFLLSLVFFLGLLLFVYDTIKKAEFDLNATIEKGLFFLAKTQEDSGELPVEMCEEKNMTDCLFVSSLFGTSSSIYALQDIPGKQTQEIIAKANAFLLSEMDQRALWRYFGKQNKNLTIVPDMDDTSLASFVLKKSNHNFPDNRSLMSKNLTSDGVFYTWIDPLRLNGPNNTDCAVNANVLLYLQESIPAVCAYINQALSEEKNCATYYPNKLAAFYAASRAAKEGVACLEQNRASILQTILQKQNADGSFGSDLENALAINTLLNFGYTGKETSQAINRLLQTQASDGSWQKDVYFDHGNDTPPYFGSAELTTALSLEALNKFKKQPLNMLHLASVRK